MPIEDNLTVILKNISEGIGDESVNNTSNKTESVNFSDHNIVSIVVLTLIYGSLSLTACVGNLLVIWIIGKYFYFKFMI